jgi:flagellar FliJ protein
VSALASMQLAVELASRQRDQVRQELAQAHKVLQFAQQQFRQLEGYAEETQARWITQSTRQAAPEVMRHYYQFMDKLQQAMALQQQVLQDAGLRLGVQQQALLEAEFRLSARQTVCDNMRREAAVRRDKLEQKVFDEMAALQYRRNRAEHGMGFGVADPSHPGHNGLESK